MSHALNRISSGLFLTMLISCSFLAGCGLALDEQDRMERAQTYAERGENRAAIIELKTVLQDNPESIEGRVMLGRVLLANGDSAGAENELKRAVELGATQNLVRTGLAEAMLKQGKFKEVLDDLADSESDPNTMVLRGNAYQGLGELEEARSAFSSALELDGDNPDALMGLTRVELMEGNREAARQLVGRARILAPDDFDILMLAGNLERMDDKTASALTVYKRALDITVARQRRDQEFSVRAALAELYLDDKKPGFAASEADRMLQISQNHPVAHFLRGRASLAEGDLGSAESHLQEVLNRIPDHQASKLMLGSINLAQGKPEQAEMYLNSLIAADPGNQAARMLLASSRAQQGQPEAVMSTLQPALEDQPSDSRILGMMGVAALQAGDTFKGIDYLEKSFASDPDNRALSLNLARAYLMDGQNGKAIEILSNIEPSTDKEQLREVLLVTALIKVKDSASARKEADKLVERNPQFAIAWNVAGGVYQATGDLEKARKFFQRSSELDPEYLPPLSNLARLSAADDDNAGARAYLQRIIEVDGRNVDAMLALTQIAARMGEQETALNWLVKAREVSAEAVNPRILLGRYYLQTGNLEMADQVINEALRIAPENINVLMVRGSLMMAKGQAKQAQELYEKAAVAAPESANVQFSLASANLALGEAGAARRALNRALDLDSDHFESAAMLSSLDMIEGKSGTALSRIAKEQARNPDAAGPFAAEGNLRMMQSDFSEAVKAYEAAWERGPSLSLANKILVARSRAGLPDASGALETWAAKNPNDVAAKLALGQAYQGAGRNAAATDMYEAVVAIQPDNPLALNNLAWLYYLAGDPRALATAEKASEIAPDAGSVTDTLGWILFKKGDLKRAESVLREAAKQEAGNPEIQYHLAAALASNGRQTEARDVLRRVLASDRVFSSRPEAAALLKELQ